MWSNARSGEILTAKMHLYSSSSLLTHTHFLQSIFIIKSLLPQLARALFPFPCSCTLPLPPHPIIPPRSHLPTETLVTRSPAPRPHLTGPSSALLAVVRGGCSSSPIPNLHLLLSIRRRSPWPREIPIFLYTSL